MPRQYSQMAKVYKKSYNKVHCINGVSKRLKHSKYGLFADDKCAYLHFELFKLEVAAFHIQSDAQVVIDWAHETGLEINYTKTKVMILGSKLKLKLLKNCELPQIIVDGHIIPYVSTTKHLGPHLSNDLSWDTHVA
ncbi:Protein of unknown function [Cotesia congregata]|uniref:Uncharacterized protein n=1 Tax=Cotesia congregata TaxID=51543 RepID=A0A8J2EAS7_COTCN|nr:Protein of unknown function [Cotesia congregata]